MNDAIPPRKSSFAPWVDAQTRILILGSLPGEQSLARGEYYGNPRNQFWRLIGAVIDADLTALDYQARLDALRKARIGLWDVIESAARHGSLDGAIRDHAPNDLTALVARLPDLRAIGFNGGTSARLGRKAIGEPEGIALLPLPSSSPAFTLGFERKSDIWLQLRDFLG